MGYFVQISDDIGRPVFQTAKNYPDVSFASSTLIHALVTASLEHGFVPSILRADDATLALTVHGSTGSRLVVALVTSELASGQTKDLEARMRWRLSAVYRAALVAVGGELLRRQPQEQLKRLLGQRLAPIVAHVMVEDAAPTLAGRVPRLGLALCGSSVEWLTRTCASDAAFEQLVSAVAERCGIASAAIALALSWQGRAVAATAAWRQLANVDQALLLALAEQVGPATFDQPARSWALEELEHLWLPSAGAARIHAADAAGSDALGGLAPLPLDAGRSSASTAEPTVARQHRMVSIRLYPSLDATGFGDGGVQCDAQKAGEESEQQGASAAELRGIREEEFSLVLSLLQEEGGDTGGEGAARSALLNLEAGINAGGEALQQAIWRSIEAAGSTSRGQSVMPGAWEEVVAAMLIDENSQDAIMLPSPWHYCAAALPWECHRRQLQATAARRLIYWLHTLPPLGPRRTQQYAYCEGYAVGGMRREDGLHCWAIMDTWHQQVDGKSSTAAGAESSSGGKRIMQAIESMLKRAPTPAEFRASS